MVVGSGMLRGGWGLVLDLLKPCKFFFLISHPLACQPPRTGALISAQQYQRKGVTLCILLHIKSAECMSPRGPELQLNRSGFEVTSIYTLWCCAGLVCEVFSHRIENLHYKERKTFLAVQLGTTPISSPAAIGSSPTD